MTTGEVIGARYMCCAPARRAALLRDGPAGLSGIDYVEVAQGQNVSDATVIRIVLVRPVARAAGTITGDQIALTGGVRFAAPRPGPVVATEPPTGPIAAYVVTIPGGQPTDFSTYRLAIVAAKGSSAPAPFLDARLSAVEFSFKAGCPADSDCAAPPPAPGSDLRAVLPAGPDPDYRIRDWPGFRQMMLDRMADLVPGFAGGDPADFTSTLIEALATRADQQSYRLDWIGTEAFLGTARARASVTRHARLVDYAPAEGASARVFAQISPAEPGSPAEGLVITAGTPLLVRRAGLPLVLGAGAYRAALAGGATVFETVAPLRIWHWQHGIAIHTWSDSACALPKGATAVTLVNGAGGGPDELRPGDFLALSEIRLPATGAAGDARPDLRHIVRLTSVAPETDPLAPAGTRLVTVTWDAADALPFTLEIGPEAAPFAAAAGNLMLADQGASLPARADLDPAGELGAIAPRLDPPRPPASGPWRPRLLAPAALSLAPARVAPADLAAVPQAPASALAVAPPAACLPAVRLEDPFAVWAARRDLVGAGRFERGFVVETGMDGAAVLRFGDGVNGLSPGTAAELAVGGRFGSGAGGNIGAGALGHILLPPSGEGLRLRISNPLPARGGAEPEPIARIRINAPEAFRTQDRAVTARDYAEAAMRHPGVANALALPRWTGAWRVMLVHVDRTGGAPVGAAFRASLLAHLEHFRLMSFDVAIRPAQPAPLDIALSVCARPGAIRAVVARRLRAALSPSGPADGSPGFFHPDRFTFGTPLYLSALTAAALATEGVQSVTATRFARLGRIGTDTLAEGVIRPTGTEILQLADDPSFPERGRLVLTMGGGR